MTPKDITPKPPAPKVKPTSGHPKPRSANPNPGQTGEPSRPPAPTAGAANQNNTQTQAAKNNPPAQAAKKNNTSTSAQAINKTNAAAQGTNDDNKPATATKPSQSTAGRGWDLERFSMYGFGADGKSFEYDSESAEFRFVANCCLIALMAIRRNDTQIALERLGERCVDHWTSPNYRRTHPEHEWQGDRTKIQEYVRTFTKGLTHTPPAIRVESDMENCYAAHARYTDYDGNFEIFRTRKCFRVKVPIELVRSIKVADEQKASHSGYLLTLRMVLALSFWHEFIHGFVSFMAGAMYSRTPPSCAPGFLQTMIQEQNRLVGESGDYMESEIWGGSMQMDFTESASAIRNCGEPFVKDDAGDERPIDIKTIKAFLRNPSNYNLKAAVLAVKPRRARPEPPAAKRRRLSASLRSEPRHRMVLAWNIKFECDADNSPIRIVKEQTAVAA